MIVPSFDRFIGVLAIVAKGKSKSVSPASCGPRGEARRGEARRGKGRFGSDSARLFELCPAI
eukprot:6386302-Lingulodinium_polyedra.AAC.1